MMPAGEDGPGAADRPTAEERFARTRQARQVFSGAELTPPTDPIGTPERFVLGPRGELRYLIALSVLIVLAALVWVAWGMGAATPLVVLLIVGLLAAWLLL